MYLYIYPQLPWTVDYAPSLALTTPQVKHAQADAAGFGEWACIAVWAKYVAERYSQPLVGTTLVLSALLSEPALHFFNLPVKAVLALVRLHEADPTLDRLPASFARVYLSFPS